MTTANNQGVGIYYETEGSGPPLVLLHGWSGSLEYWRDFGYTRPLSESYQLILIDVRGHGRSDVPDVEEAYDTDLMAGDVIAVLDALNIEQAHFLGYSMGGWIGFHLGIENPSRFLSMIIGGAHPYPEDLSPIRQFAQEGGETIVGAWDSVDAPLSDGVRQQLSQHPALPLAAAVRNDRSDLSKSLHRMQMPTLIYAGDQDFRYQGVKDCVKELPKAKWVSIAGLDHLSAMARSELVLPHLHEFLDEVSAASSPQN